MVVLSDELCKRIALWIDREDLLALAQTCKLFHKAAVSIIYSSIHPPRVYAACQSITNRHCLGAHVRSFALYHPENYRYRRGTALTFAFWTVLSSALSTMVNLESLILVDPTGSNTWVLDGVKSKVLREVKVRLMWDEHLVQLLLPQIHLRHLECADSSSDNDPGLNPLPPGSLPDLRSFEGPMLVAVQLLSCPSLTHMHLFLDPGVTPYLCDFLLRIGQTVGKQMRGLHLHEVPEDLVIRALQLVVDSCPNLLHLGVIPLASQNRTRQHKSLQSLPLDTLEVSLHRWGAVQRIHPQQNPSQGVALIPAMQRILVTELKMYCSTLSTVILWLGSQRFLWRLVEVPEIAHHEMDGDEGVDQDADVGVVGTGNGEQLWRLCPEWEGIV